MTELPPSRVRVLQVISRLNVGGPAHDVTILSSRLDPLRYETVLLCGEPGAVEGSLDHLAHARGVTLRRVRALGPAVRPWNDLRALGALIRHVRAFRPDIVHTHTAKAGMLGRLAARIALGRQPVVVHTYHGHVLRGYFGPVAEAAYRLMERGLGRLSDRLIGVSRATVDELVDLRVAPHDKFVAIPLGLDLERFFEVEPSGGGLRDELRAPQAALVVSVVGRLVRIKRVDMLLNAVALARQQGADVRLAVIGDGELRPALEAQAASLGDAVRFLGFRHDLPSLAAGTDLAALSSDNEGTPVALIEAAAAGSLRWPLTWEA